VGGTLISATRQTGVIFDSRRWEGGSIIELQIKVIQLGRDMRTLTGVCAEKIKVVPKDFLDNYRPSKEYLIFLWTSKNNCEEIHVFVDDNTDKFILPGQLEIGAMLMIENCHHKHGNYWEVMATQQNPLTAIVVRENDWNNGIYQDNVQGSPRKFQVDTETSTRHAPESILPVGDGKKDFLSGQFQIEIAF